MFGALTEKFQNLFSSLTGKKVLTEDNIAEAVREVRLALLDADVNYAVASDFVKRVKEKALGNTVFKSVRPGEQFAKLVHDELVLLMGAGEAALDLKAKLSVLMVCGLQGAGKTTTCAKLAAYIRKTEKHKKILLAACDLQRPAAVAQLKKLGSDQGFFVFYREEEKNPVKMAGLALEHARKEGYDVLIVDTAGRLHLDVELMEELSEVKQILDPQEILFVANAMTGQSAVKVAAEFDSKIQITGTILTMLDGNARAGAAISIREVTKKPLKFEGVGEKIADLQVFNPRSMADRILGMGDMINLVRKAQENFTEEQGAQLEKKLKEASFTYDDYLIQMGRMKKMGSFKSLLKMLPGMGMLEDLNFDDKEFTRLEAMILSMTQRERSEKDELSHTRRKRIALGSGVAIDEVNRMVKSFKKLKQLFKSMPDMKAQAKKMGLSGLSELKNQIFEGKKWH